MTRCRGVLEDCYSSSRYRRGNHGHRSRPVAPGGSQLTWRKKINSAKKVTFANPLFQVLGEYSHQTDFSLNQVVIASTTPSNWEDWFDPMREELFIPPCYSGQLSKEERIRNLLVSAPGWAPIASPTHHSDSAEEGLQLGCTETLQVSYMPAFPSSPLPHTAVLENGEQELEHTTTAPGQNSDNSNTQPSSVSAHHLVETAQQTDAYEPTEQEPSIEHFPVEQSLLNLDTEGLNDKEQNQPINGQQTITQLSANEPVHQPELAEQDTIDDLASFIDFISCTPPAPILNSPPATNPIPRPETFAEPQTTQRKSTRLANKAKLHPGKDSVQLAQKVLINKLGELSPGVKEQASSNTDFNKLAQHLPQPLTSAKMEAIKTLVEKGNQPKNKKKSRVLLAPETTPGAHKV